jgi:uncharacterized protein YaiL (DUF2058 family)
MPSLQDQLLKAGLVDKSKANKVKKEKQKKSKLKRKGGGDTGDQVKQAARLEQAKKVERDRELNRQRLAEANRKAELAQVRQLVEMNRVDRQAGDIAYSFVDQGKVRNIYVTEQLQKQLSLGRLAIVTVAQGGNRIYELVPAGVAEKIAQRHEQAVVHISVSDGTQQDEDDPYAEFEIPDDLMW